MINEQERTRKMDAPRAVCCWQIVLILRWNAIYVENWLCFIKTNHSPCEFQAWMALNCYWKP